MASSLQSRVQQIVQAYNAGKLTVAQANRLLQDPSISVPQYIAAYSPKAYSTTQPATGGNYRGASTASYKEDIPYSFCFQNYRKFLAPSKFGTKSRPFVLPVTPEEIQISLGNTAVTITTVGGRSFSHAIGVDLEKISFSGVLPSATDADLSNLTHLTPGYDQSFTSGKIAHAFREAMKANQPLVFGVLREVTGPIEPNKPRGIVVPLEVTITNFTRTIKHGTGADVWFEMELQRWNPQKLKTGTARTSSSDKPSDDGSNPQRQKYKTEAGDTLANIAHSQLGDMDRWREIYRLNKGRFDTGKLWEVSGGSTGIGLIRRIKPGIILLVPKRST